MGELNWKDAGFHILFSRNSRVRDKILRTLCNSSYLKIEPTCSPPRGHPAEEMKTSLVKMQSERHTFCCLLRSHVCASLLGPFIFFSVLFSKALSCLSCECNFYFIITLKHILCLISNSLDSEWSARFTQGARLSTINYQPFRGGGGGATFGYCVVVKHSVYSMFFFQDAYMHIVLWALLFTLTDRTLVGGEIFHTRPDRPRVPPIVLYTECRVSSPEVMRLGRGFGHPPLSSTEVKERIELYLYFPSDTSWPVLGWSEIHNEHSIIVHLVTRGVLGRRLKAL
jgi:hypothetical protein